MGSRIKSVAVAWMSAVVLMSVSGGCIHYSLSGVSTTAKTISIEQFFNNSDLAPANLGAEFTNKVKELGPQTKFKIEK